ncbi:MAG: hypothetical protein ACK4IY_05445, partial [Chitinophagales bacterium]
KALEREREEKEKAEKQKRINELQQVDDEGNEDIQKTEDKGETNVTDDKKTTGGGAVGATAVTLDNTITKKGNMYEGNALVNGTEQTKYILNPNPTLTVAMISDEFYIQLRNAGTVSDADFTNDKATTLSDGTTVKGDLFKLQTLQVGDVVLKDVVTKINTTTPQALIVGVKVIEGAGCTFDAKNLKYKCK